MMEDQQEEAKQPVVEEETSPAVMSALRLEQKGHRWVGRRGGGGGGRLAEFDEAQTSTSIFEMLCQPL